MGLTGAIIFTIAGIVFAAVGWVLTDKLRAYRRGKRIPAKVLRIEESTSAAHKQGMRTNIAYFEITDHDGAPHEVRSLFSSSGYTFPVGSIRQVYRLPDSDRVLVADVIAPYGMSLGFLALGGICAGAGLLGLTGYL